MTPREAVEALDAEVDPAVCSEARAILLRVIEQHDAAMALVGPGKPWRVAAVDLRSALTRGNP